MKFATIKQADEYLTESVESYKPVLNALMWRIAVDRCMYEGCQWISSNPGSFNVSATTGRRLTNWDPDTNRLVATVNRIIPLIRECAAATYPEKMEVDVNPPDRDTGIEATERARVLEAAIHAIIESSNYLNAACDTNFRRCIDGAHGIGLRIKLGQRQIEGEYEDDQILTAFDFDATKLTLDPHNQSRDLREHESVIFSDVWTRDAINKYFGLKLEDNDCQTVGELCEMQMRINRLSENRLYANLPNYSKTKGAIVHQMHVRDGTCRFDKMYVGVQTAGLSQEGTAARWINFDDPATPFAGEHALPFALLHGATRPDSMWSMSDAYLLKDDQDRINLLATLAFRLLQKNAGYQWLVPKGAYSGKDSDSFRQQFSNCVAGVIEVETGTRDRPVPYPEMVQSPPPPPFIQEMIQVYEDAQRRQVHREEITSGGYKTHTTNQTFQTARESANQVLGNRVRDDMGFHGGLLNTLLGTSVKLAREGSPSALAALRRAGFDDADFAIISQVDPNYPACSISIRESSIRYQSREEKEARLWKATELQAIPPLKLRRALADMDTPLDGTDKAMYDAARKAAVRILLGETWQPISLGEHVEVFLEEFRQAAVCDRRAQMDPAARERLFMAIEAQLAYTNSEIQQAALAQQPPTPEQSGAGGGAQEQAEMPQEVNIADLITSLNSGGGGAQSGTQPAAA